MATKSCIMEMNSNKTKSGFFHGRWKKILHEVGNLLTFLFKAIFYEMKKRKHEGRKITRSPTGGKQIVDLELKAEQEAKEAENEAAKQEQEAKEAAKQEAKQEVKEAKEVDYHELERLWYAICPLVEINLVSTCDFVFDMMYRRRILSVCDDKSIIQISRHLNRWLKKMNRSNIDVLFEARMGATCGLCEMGYCEVGKGKDF